MSKKAPEHVLQALAFLAAAYPHFKLTQPTIAAYSVLLSDIPAQALQGAALQLAAEGGDWFPTAGALRAAAFDLLHSGEPLPTAQEAWADVKRCMATYGHAQLPQFAHELTAQAVEGIGGWRTLCTASMDKDMSDRARFMQAYDALVARLRHDQRLLPAIRQYQQLAAQNKVDEAVAQLQQVMSLPGGDNA